MLETPWAPPTQQEAPPSLDLLSNQIQSLPAPAAASSPQQQNLPAEEPELESGPMLLLSETLQQSLGADSAEPLPDGGPEQNQAASESQSDPDPPSASEPARTKTDRLSRLKELGLDPPPPAKLSPDDGVFVQLDPPHCNPGEKRDRPGPNRPGSPSESESQSNPDLPVNRSGGPEGALPATRPGARSSAGGAHRSAHHHP